MNQKEWQANNREKCRAYNKKWRDNNRDYVLAKRKLQVPAMRGYAKKFRKTLKGKLNNWKNSALRRGISWNLNLTDIEQAPLVCYYTGVELSFESHQPNSISLDRLDNSRGYEIDNIVFCCEIINRMKWKFGLTDFLSMCKKITDNYEKEILIQASHDSNQVESGNKLSTRFSNVKSRAKRKQREFSLDYVSVCQRPFNCFYTHEPLTCEPNKPNTVSFDRLDSSVGYTNDNTVLCCHYINLMKQEMPLPDFLNACRLITYRHG